MLVARIDRPENGLMERLFGAELCLMAKSSTAQGPWVSDIEGCQRGKVRRKAGMRRSRSS